MKYISLSDDQAYRFNEVGELLIVEDANHPLRDSSFPVSPYQVGESVGFKEPWVKIRKDGKTLACRIRQCGGSIPSGQVMQTTDLPEFAVVLFGRCAKIEGKKLGAVTYEDINLAGSTTFMLNAWLGSWMERHLGTGPDTLCWFITFVK